MIIFFHIDSKAAICCHIKSGKDLHCSLSRSLKRVSGQMNWGSKAGTMDRYMYRTVALEVKKFGSLPSSCVLSISVSAKYSIKLYKYAADFASVLQFCLSALVFPTFCTVER